MNILDPRFRYTPACATDISKTFARVRREQAAARAVADQQTSQERADTARIHMITNTRNARKG